MDQLVVLFSRVVKLRVRFWVRALEIEEPPDPCPILRVDGGDSVNSGKVPLPLGSGLKTAFPDPSGMVWGRRDDISTWLTRSREIL